MYKSCHLCAVLVVDYGNSYVCGGCVNGSKNILNMINNLSASVSPSNGSKKSVADCLAWIKELKETKDELEMKLTHHNGFVAAYRDQIHTDILVKPGNSEPSIPAHRALLAVRSKIFKNMLDSERWKAPPNSTITLPELNHEELDSLMEFLYSGHLPKEKLEKHAWSLFVAADKYEIPFLQKLCEDHILEYLNSSNALDILEQSGTYSSLRLKKAALSIISKDGKNIVFSARFEEIALKNPHLGVEITRALFSDQA